MKWRVELRPEVEQDVAEAAAWYNCKQAGLGPRFRDIISLWDDLAENPLVASQRHPTKNIRWRYPEHFPYRVIYEVIEEEQRVIVAAVLHAARFDRSWKGRIE